MSKAKTSNNKNNIALGIIISFSVIVIIILLAVFLPKTNSSIYKIRLEGNPGKAIQIARMFIRDANNNDVALTTDESWYDPLQVWSNDREDARPDNIIKPYNENNICEDEYELHTTAENRGIWHTMMNDDHPDPRIRMKKGDVNFANFKTAKAVDLTGATVHVLGRYHCKHKWQQMGEAFTIKVTNVDTGKVATVEVPKLRYDEEGYRIQHDEELVFV